MTTFVGCSLLKVGGGPRFLALFPKQLPCVSSSLSSSSLSTSQGYRSRSWASSRSLNIWASSRSPVRIVPSVSPVFFTPMRSFGRGDRGSKDKQNKKPKKGAKKGKVEVIEGSPVDLEDLRETMKGSVDYLTTQYSGLTIGRASPSLLEAIEVKAYGDLRFLTDVGQISSRSSQLIVVSVHDEELIGAVQTAIREQLPLNGVTPYIEGNMVFVPFPKPTKEVRDQLVKEAKKKTEEAKTSLRNMRKSALQKLKTNKGGLTDDEFHRISANVQTIFNDVSDQIDSMAKTKVKDLEK